MDELKLRYEGVGYTILDDEIRNKYGLYARRGMEIVEACKDYEGRVLVKKVPYEERLPEEGVDAKSIMSLMSLGAVKGTKLEVRIEGLDEKAAEIARKIHKVLLFDGECWLEIKTIIPNT